MLRRPAISHYLPGLFLIFALLSLQPSLAFAQSEIELPSGTTMSAALYQGEGKQLVLWLPSERGMRPEYVTTASELAAKGVDVWALDLHENYMLAPGRDSLNDVDRDELLELIAYAETLGFKRITFLTSGRGAVLALELAAGWYARNQSKENQGHPSKNYPLNGHIFFTPHLLDGSPQAGDKASYLPVARQAALPIYVIQPEYSTKYARSQEIADVLSEGGSQVFTQRLKGVAGGFQMRSEVDLSADDLRARAALPKTIANALKLIQGSEIASRQVREVPAKQASSGAVFEGKTLIPYKGKNKKLPLALSSLSGEHKQLKDYRGKVVLINFWASWCGPCAEEIPSLSRLVTQLKAKPFEVVTVNIGEDSGHIREFIADLPVNFEILMDTEGQAVRDWNVYAYPTNYLIDRNGFITHAYKGALEWDSPEVVELIEANL